MDDVTVKFKFAAPAPAFTTLLATTYTHEWAPKHYLKDLLPKYNPDADAEAKAENFDSWTARFIPLYYSDWEDANHQYGLPKLEAWLKVDETPEHQLFVPNPYYYKVDTAGQQLPYIDEVEEVYAADEHMRRVKARHDRCVRLFGADDIPQADAALKAAQLEAQWIRTKYATLFRLGIQGGYKTWQSKNSR